MKSKIVAVSKVFTGYFSLFTKPTINEVIENDIEKELLAARQCDITILDARFLKHMSEKKIDGMIEWRAIRKVETDMIAAAAAIVEQKAKGEIRA